MKSETVKALILYGSQEKLTRMHVQVAGHGSVGGHWQKPYFVRTDTFNGNCVDALEKASPMQGETVLNTIDYHP
jgi:hypothetical protein